jgi:A/G-specific adenine glycosylase
MLNQKVFLKELYRWADEHPRPMPWRDERDAYKIWVSEIMLQQTQVEQARPYFLAFMADFPRVSDLAAATEQAVLKRWQGLGYNSRARNLHHAAKQVVEQYKGVFPSEYAEILELKGIGPYTAAAIASFAFSKPFPVIDTNVVRILARLIGLVQPINSAESQRVIKERLGQFFDQNDPARFNQAIMDFGALQCAPRKPNCEICPFSVHCQAYLVGLVEQIPKKAQKAERKRIDFFYLVISHNGGLYLRQRTGDGVWKGMYEFAEGEIKTAQIGDEIPIPGGFGKVLAVSKQYQQVLTHRLVYATFCLVKPAKAWLPTPELIHARKENIKKNYPIPNIIDKYLTNFEIP